jgi:hypothetical protein
MARYCWRGGGSESTYSAKEKPPEGGPEFGIYIGGWSVAQPAPGVASGFGDGGGLPQGGPKQSEAEKGRARGGEPYAP